MNHKLIGIASALCAGFTPHDDAKYPGWQHQGSCFILTTPEGADLPATAAEQNFPLLLRLHKGTFDFSQAQPGGADLRISAGGQPPVYQLEEGDAATGTASGWVKIPAIKGNAQQEIKSNIRNYYVYQVWPLPCGMGPRTTRSARPSGPCPRSIRICG
ncbi:MAG: hypothetical protein NTW21_41495 [Verrucomicrobia bacterium]|nr:hypothetical protein [Verrucomicrobiota bacterium]